MSQIYPETIINEIKNKNLRVAQVFIDFKIAFDTIPPFALKYAGHTKGLWCSEATGNSRKNILIICRSTQ